MRAPRCLASTAAARHSLPRPSSFSIDNPHPLVGVPSSTGAGKVERGSTTPPTNRGVLLPAFRCDGKTPSHRTGSRCARMRFSPHRWWPPCGACAFREGILCDYGPSRGRGTLLLLSSAATYSGRYRSPSNPCLGPRPRCGAGRAEVWYTVSGGSRSKGGMAPLRPRSLARRAAVRLPVFNDDRDRPWNEAHAKTFPGFPAPGP